MQDIMKHFQESNIMQTICGSLDLVSRVHFTALNARYIWRGIALVPGILADNE